MLQTDDLFLGAFELVRGGELRAVEVRGTNGRRVAVFTIIGPTVDDVAREQFEVADARQHLRVDESCARNRV